MAHKVTHISKKITGAGVGTSTWDGVGSCSLTMTEGGSNIIGYILSLNTPAVLKDFWIEVEVTEFHLIEVRLSLVTIPE